MSSVLWREGGGVVAVAIVCVFFSRSQSIPEGGMRYARGGGLLMGSCGSSGYGDDRSFVKAMM